MASHRLGWYVHYRTQNYKNYGLGYNEKTKESKVTPAELNAYKKEMIYQTRQNISDSNIESFEKLFNDFTYGMTFNNKEDKELYNKIINKMLEILNNTIHEKYSYKSKLLTNVKNFANLTGKSNLNQINTKSNISTVQKFIQELDNLWKNNEKMINHLKYEDIQKNKQKFYDCSAKLKRLVNQYKAENPNVGSNFFVMYNKGDVGAQLRTVMKEARELLLLNTIPSENQITGIYAEEFTNLLINVSHEKILENQEITLKEVYRKLINLGKTIPNVRVSGQDKSSTTKDKSNYAKGIVKFGSDGFFASTQATYNKADVEIQYKNRNTIGTSVKNYGFFNGSGNISLVDGVSMDDIIDNMNTTFVNHWLNLKTINNKESSQSRLQNLRIKADTVMKIGILSRAASGRLSGRSGVADVLAINSRHGQSWRFISIQKLVNDIVNNENLLNRASFSNYPKDHILQSWSGSKKKPSSAEAMKRISAVLAKLEQHKLSVTLKVANIQSGEFTI